MKLYNVIIDETEEVSLAFYLKHRFFKFLKVDVPIALTHSIVVPAKAICRKCIEGFVCDIVDGENFIGKYLKQRRIKKLLLRNPYWVKYHKEYEPWLNKKLGVKNG